MDVLAMAEEIFARKPDSRELSSDDDRPVDRPPKPPRPLSVGKMPSASRLSCVRVGNSLPPSPMPALIPPQLGAADGSEDGIASADGAAVDIEKCGSERGGSDSDGRPDAVAIASADGVAVGREGCGSEKVGSDRCGRLKCGKAERVGSAAPKLGRLIDGRSLSRPEKCGIVTFGSLNEGREVMVGIGGSSLFRCASSLSTADKAGSEA